MGEICGMDFASYAIWNELHQNVCQFTLWRVIKNLFFAKNSSGQLKSPSSRRRWSSRANRRLLRNFALHNKVENRLAQFRWYRRSALIDSYSLFLHGKRSEIAFVNLFALTCVTERWMKTHVKKKAMTSPCARPSGKYIFHFDSWKSRWSLFLVKLKTHTL